MRNDVTVIIPVYNGALYLAECVASVLDQTLAASEVIIVDDGSEDATPDVAAALGGRVRYHRIPHGGLPYARNAGIALVQTELIAFVDSDDLWLPRKLELQVAALAQAKPPAIIFGHLQQFVSPDLAPEEAALLRASDAAIPGWLGSTLLMRKRDFELAGRFDESLALGEFIEWSSRARDAGIEQIMIPETVCRRRLHRANMSRGMSSKQMQYAQMLKKVLDRRRGST
ncbi:glycosyltransferase family 2 protein [Bradyrhizobium sp.]|uniref:glycosyltransferase family 2 protein n=1 Tax=Bradyrhizobium sp. TaxID=376 RepID=UPI0039E5B822